MLKASVKKRDEIKLMREGGKILAEIVRKMAEETKPGIVTMELEDLATRLLKSTGVVSPFKGYDGYKYNSCLSVNNVVVHGEPSTKVILKEGDLLKIDLGVNFHGMITDHAITVIVGDKTTPTREKLVACSKMAMMSAIKGVREGEDLANITYRINDTAEVFGFSPVRELVGHGVGYQLHEDPNISCYRGHALRMDLKEGMTFAIEAMINEGSWKCASVKGSSDIVTMDGKDSATFEHTIVVNKEGFEILTI